MSAPKQPERNDHYHCPAPRNKCWQTIISDPKPGCEEILRRQNNASHKDQCHQRAIGEVDPAQHFLVALCASAKDPANADVDNQADQINEIPCLNSHRCASGQMKSDQPTEIENFQRMMGDRSEIGDQRLIESSVSNKISYERSRAA